MEVEASNQLWNWASGIKLCVSVDRRQKESQFAKGIQKGTYGRRRRRRRPEGRRRRDREIFLNPRNLQRRGEERREEKGIEILFYFLI